MSQTSFKAVSADDPAPQGSDAMHAKYYKRAPDAALSAGGTAFMS